MPVYVASHMGIRTRKPKDILNKSHLKQCKHKYREVPQTFRLLFAIFVYICSSCSRLVPQVSTVSSNKDIFSVVPEEICRGAALRRKITEQCIVSLSF